MNMPGERHSTHIVHEKLCRAVIKYMVKEKIK